MDLEIVEISEAARIAEVSTDTIRRAANSGHIKHIKTTGGRRLFQRKDVERFKEARHKKKAS